MDIWQADKLFLFLVFVIPGFISLKTYELIIPRYEKETSKQIIDAIAYSCINYAFLLIPIIFVETKVIKNDNPFLYYFFYLFIFFIAPIIWVLLWEKIRKTNFFQNIAPHPIKKPWDYVFEQRKPYWMKITLINGSIVGGKYSSNSFASSSPVPEQIYLEECWIINDRGGFERPKNNTAGIIIMQNRIAYIEFRKFEED